MVKSVRMVLSADKPKRRVAYPKGAILTLAGASLTTSVPQSTAVAVRVRVNGAEFTVCVLSPKNPTSGPMDLRFQTEDVSVVLRPITASKSLGLHMNGLREVSVHATVSSPFGPKREV
jgi:hypothetical protein